MNHLDDNQLTLLYFQEAPESTDAHCAECESCRARYQALAAFLDAMRAIPVPEKGGDWDGRLWNGIAPRVQADLQRPRRRFRPWVLAPALAGLLAIAFFAGMYTENHSPRPTAAFSTKSRERVLLIAMGDHFDRSQIVLAELMNAPGGKPFNLTDEQRLTSGLLPENRLLRQTALRTGDRSDASVLDDLERVLIEIAHSPAEISAPDLDRLQQRIAAQGLLFKVRVIGANTREKGRNL